LLHTSLSEKQLSLALAESWTLNDAGLSIREAAATDQWELRSGRVFMDKSIEKAIGNTGFEATPILTYFANSIGHKSKETPYSFVSTLSDSELTADEMVVNRWLADDIGVKVGDSVRMTYFEVGPLRELTEVSTSFRIKKVVEATGYYGDRKLMPDIPGLSDAENCRDWNTGVPVNLKSIRDKDEEYWYNYRGLPKAFISYSEAEKLWANRFGNTTAWRFSNAAISKEDLERALTDNLDPFSLDVQLRSVKSEGMDAAINGTDFSSLFLGLSFFILVAGLLLTALLFVYNIDRRMGEIGNYASLGFSNKTIQTLFLGEGLFVAFAGAIPGILLAVVYNELVFWGLNRVWNDIVRTEVLVSQYRIFTLIIGLVISVFVSMGTIWLVLRQAMKRSVVQLQRRQKTEAPHWVRLLKKYASHLFTGLGVALLIVQLVRPGNVDAGIFFMAGGALLIAFLLHADSFLSYKTKSQSRKISIPKLALQNLREGRSRSILVISLALYRNVRCGFDRNESQGFVCRCRKSERWNRWFPFLGRVDRAVTA
jgi:putative ABC transport system permease protein